MQNISQGEVKMADNYSDLSLEQLRRELRQRTAKVSGRKAELVARLVSASAVT